MEDLVGEMFPRAMNVVWEGATPRILANNEIYYANTPSAGFTGFLQTEEIVMVVKHAETPHRLGEEPSTFNITFINILHNTSFLLSTTETISKRMPPANERRNAIDPTDIANSNYFAMASARDQQDLSWTRASPEGTDTTDRPLRDLLSSDYDSPSADPYLNTSFEEPEIPWGDYAREANERLVTTADPDDAYALPHPEAGTLARRPFRELGGAYMGAPTSEELRRVNTERVIVPSRADNVGDELTAHYRLEAAIRKAFDAAIAAFEKKGNAAAFKAHMLNAQVVCVAEVRTVDVLTWFRDLPPKLQKAITKLQTYLHKEVYLRHSLAVIEHRNRAIDEWSPEHDYAVVRYKHKAKYGYETKTMGMEKFTPRFEQQGRLFLRYLNACLQVRIVRTEQAIAKERHGTLKWEEGVGGKVYRWIETVEKCLKEKVEAVDLPYVAHRQGSTDSTVQSIDEAARQQEEEKVKVAFALTKYKDETKVYYDLITALKARRELLQARRTDVQLLQSYRQERKTADKAAAVAMEAGNKDEIASTEFVVRAWEDKEDALVGEMIERYGERAEWDWVKE
ncbi:hypothetical protein LTR56_010014 [Elasticomyces elasticus]|nr:hypothetical protein LTR56_010014 [Elasticomyces elasticus]KAK3665047.1 hypothetical protein LTR22_004102 [Elasticomyces elasticus]KAK4931576.1 hypothetical protein LTR49_001965 [Elasticomyces elasticus]KAK5766736.1 hypothetical protein LTS12_003086 [Elasticomyces elasticus]